MDLDLADLFASVGASLDVVRRVDQTWDRAWIGGAGGIGPFVQATNDIVETVVDGLAAWGAGAAVSPPGEGDTTAVAGWKAHFAEFGEALEHDAPVRTDATSIGLEWTGRDQVVHELVSRVIAAPLTQPDLSPGVAVCTATVLTLSAEFDLGVEDVHAPTALADLMPHRRSSEGRHAVRAADDFLRRVLEEVASDAAPIPRIRRVLRPDTDEDLATWLGTSRPTIRAWARSGIPRGGTRSQRARVVDGIAQILDENLLSADDVVAYVHDTKIDALGGRRLVDVLTSGSTAELIEARDGLADALVW